MLGGVRVSGVASLGSSAAAGAFSLLDTMDMLRVIVYYGFQLRLGKYALEPSRSFKIRCVQIGSRYLILLSLEVFSLRTLSGFIYTARYHPCVVFPASQKRHCESDAGVVFLASLK
jgi:hypothetical protein